MRERAQLNGWEAEDGLRIWLFEGGKEDDWFACHRQRQDMNDSNDDARKTELIQLAFMMRASQALRQSEHCDE